jgi:[glutamine synthetase] adenylyltransferase / [glutamine synthetase]-adenylyl-L-tyrosine phosphorylase
MQQNLLSTLQSRMHPPYPGAGDANTFLQGVRAGSPYLAGLMEADEARVAAVLRSDPDAELEALLAEVRRASDLMPQLRQLKVRFALLCALCDLAHVWSLAEVMDAITRFADACIQAVVNGLLHEAQTQGKLHLPDAADPSFGCGYVVLAMGKHGASELNYSSDVDLIVLYDADTSALPPQAEVAKFFVKLTQRLVNILQEQTPDGYVFRTDLRLRPDPRATQIAISIQSAEHYYLNQGQNWERAAYIKARAIAGDLALGESFLQSLQPYIWRKYLDFAAIADVQSLIRQIHAVKGHGEIAVEGHNLKLGRGGIREIEFFVQTQQLIAGGRNPNLRGRRTVDMLDALAEAGWITADTASDLKQAYVKLRQWEHRAQMQRDEQTHVVPSGAAFDVFARFCGHADENAFRSVVRQTLEQVRAHSSKLFEQSENLGGQAGGLVFTGGEDDPDTIATLNRMGFNQASEVSATIRGWHFGRYAATRDKRAREALTELMPKLLEALSNSGDADRAFRDFDSFLKGQPAGVQLFALFKSNPGLLDLLAQILGTAPRLAQQLSRQPRILEAVLDPNFFRPLPTRDELFALSKALLPAGLSLDEAMDRMRVFAREQKFRVGVRVLSETVSAEDAGLGFANLADVVLTGLLDAVQKDIERQHGQFPSGRVAVVAMGKLGGREMTAGSDLDLIVVYDHQDSDASSDGPRPLAASPYYTKLTQRLITALTAPTAEGDLYDVDMRLRPSGSQGPVAVSFSSFATYQAESAWTWEKLALTRARPLAGDPSLCSDIHTIKRMVLAAPRDVAQTRADVVTMRSLMLREHKPQAPWDIKRTRGGLVEIEFLAQFLQLIYESEHVVVFDTNTVAAITKLRQADCISVADSETLTDAARLYHRLTQLLRLCLDQDYDPATALPGLNRALAQSVGLPDVRAVEDLLTITQSAVASVFDRLIGPPQEN